MRRVKWLMRRPAVMYFTVTRRQRPIAVAQMVKQCAALAMRDCGSVDTVLTTIYAYFDYHLEQGKWPRKWILEARSLTIKSLYGELLKESHE